MRRGARRLRPAAATVVINAHGRHPNRARTDGQLVRTAQTWTVWDHQPAAEVNPGDGAAERASYAHDTGRNGDAADPDWQAGVASGAMLDVRCWMGYGGSKKVRTSALKRAGCSMCEA
jgi:hypothetical protein